MAGFDCSFPHFIYCQGDSYHGTEQVSEIFLEQMRKYEIPSSMLTILRMWKRNLITKENTKCADLSINDDLETFLNEFEMRENMNDEIVYTVFQPKLSEEEMMLVEKKNEEHMNTYGCGLRADVGLVDMKKSKSTDKYLNGRCWRKTIHLKEGDFAGGRIFIIRSLQPDQSYRDSWDRYLETVSKSDGNSINLWEESD